jgi:hypothetical protein
MELLDHGAFLARMAERCGGGDTTPGRLLSLLLGGCEVGPARAVADVRYSPTFGGRERIADDIQVPAAANFSL